MIRFCLLVTVAVAACCAVSMAAGEKPIGRVRMSVHAAMNNTSVDDGKVAEGTTIYSGDSFSTGTGGGLEMLLGTGLVTTDLVTLRSESAAIVRLNEDRIQVSVRGGLVQFGGDRPEAIQIETPVGVIKATNGQLFSGDVTILSPTSVLISDRKGVLILESEGETRSMEAGKAYDVSLEPPDPNAAAAAAAAQGAQGAGTSHNHRGRLVFDVVLLGTAATTAACLWGTSESPSSFCGGSF